MAKIDKSQYSKHEWRIIRDRRRREKAKAHQEKDRNEKENRTDPEPEVEITRNFDTAFVLGNGTSRQNIELKRLRLHGTIYACNAVYRTFAPDFLIAVDTKMVLEIVKTGYQDKNQVWTNYNKAYDKVKNLNYFNPSKGWSSGPTALDFASRNKHQTIYILGFDFRGNGEKLNNVFADTPNYKRSVDRATYWGNWLRQTITTIKKFPNTRYIRVTEQSDPFVPEELGKLENLSHISIEEFKKTFNIP